MRPTGIRSAAATIAADKNAEDDRTLQAATRKKSLFFIELDSKLGGKGYARGAYLDQHRITPYPSCVAGAPARVRPTLSRPTRTDLSFEFRKVSPRHR